MGDLCSCGLVRNQWQTSMGQRALPRNKEVAIWHWVASVLYTKLLYYCPLLPFLGHKRSTLAEDSGREGQCFSDSMAETL